MRLLLFGAGLAALHVVGFLAFMWVRWRQRRRHSYRLRSKDGGVIQVEVLGPFKPDKRLRGRR